MWTGTVAPGLGGERGFSSCSCLQGRKATCGASLLSVSSSPWPGGFRGPGKGAWWWRNSFLWKHEAARTCSGGQAECGSGWRKGLWQLLQPRDPRRSRGSGGDVKTACTGRFSVRSTWIQGLIVCPLHLLRLESRCWMGGPPYHSYKGASEPLS